MPFEPGESGNPGGRPKSAKEWREAIRLAVNRPLEDFERLDAHPPAQPKVIDALAASLVKKGLSGDVHAIREIADRLDGKATQAVEHMGDGGGPVEVKPSPTEAARAIAFMLAAAAAEGPQGDTLGRIEANFATNTDARKRMVNSVPS